MEEPILTRIHLRPSGSKIDLYKAMIYLGAVLGCLAESYGANQLGLNSVHVLFATLLFFTLALIGARLFFVATHWSLYRRNPRRILDRKEGGMALYGGLPLSLLLSWLFLRTIGIPIGLFADLTAIGILVGMIFGRFGCLLHGCCCGRETNSRFGVYLPNQQGIWRRRIPTQLLEVCLAAGLLIGAIALWNYRAFPGFLFIYSVAGYAAGRYLLEPTRENQERIGRIRLHRAISLVLIALSIMVSLSSWQ